MLRPSVLITGTYSWVTDLHYNGGSHVLPAAEMPTRDQLVDRAMDALNAGHAEVRAAQKELGNHGVPSDLADQLGPAAITFFAGYLAGNRFDPAVHTVAWINARIEKK